MVSSQVLLYLKPPLVDELLRHCSNCTTVFQENKWMKQFLEEEQKSRKELERLVRKLSKQKNDCAWEDGGH